MIERSEPRVSRAHPQRRPRPARLTGTSVLEPLESRRLFVQVMYTWGGDANLDGKVNADDYAYIDFGTVPPNTNVAGTARNDVIEVGMDGPNVRVTVNGVSTSRGTIPKLYIDARRGDDVILVAPDVTIPMTIYGGAGNDSIACGSGADKVFAGDGDDTVNSGGGRDTIYADAGNDSIRGGGSSDLLDGGADNDMVRGDAGNDNLAGGDGFDRLRGSAGDDTLVGGASKDFVGGEAGNDLLRGEGGGDILSGGDGDDQLFGGAGNDFASGNAGNDLVSGDNGVDLVHGGAGNDGFSSYDSDAEVKDLGEEDLEPGSVGGATITIGANTKFIYMYTGDKNLNGVIDFEELEIVDPPK
jgi:Ca2+-binding RTX toxin-like protein